MTYFGIKSAVNFLISTKNRKEMNARSNTLLIGPVAVIVIAAAVFASMALPQNISAESENLVSVIPINDEISIEKTVTMMDIPQDNTFPWGVVSGNTATDHIVDGYPVIIQIYQDGTPVHFAQADVEDDGSYEYTFRIRNLDTGTGEFINIFEGTYTVIIYKVITSSSTI